MPKLELAFNTPDNADLFFEHGLRTSDWELTKKPTLSTVEYIRAVGFFKIMNATTAAALQREAEILLLEQPIFS